MKISNEPVTLSPKLSRYIRALAHAMGLEDINHLVDRVMFAPDPDNVLECLAVDADEPSPEWNRRWEAQELAIDAGDSWDKFVEISESMPSFNPADYPVDHNAPLSEWNRRLNRPSEAMA